MEKHSKNSKTKKENIDKKESIANFIHEKIARVFLYNKEDKKEDKKIEISKYNKDILTNMIYAVISIAYFIALNIVYQYCTESIFKIYTQVSYMLFLVLGILEIEIAYKKNNNKIAVYGVEYIVIATYILLIETITTAFDLNLKKYIVLSSYIFPIYYTLKTILIDTKQRINQYKGLSDIKEIVKAEKPSKKVAKKRKV